MHIIYLFNGFLQTIPSISVAAAWETVVPVLFTMSMGIFFEFVSDLRRWRNDHKINGYEVTKVWKEAGQIVKEKVKSSQLVVGDVVLFQDGCAVPADCVVLQTDDKLGQCYINTSNLDGERNLKPKLAP